MSEFNYSSNSRKSKETEDTPKVIKPIPMPVVSNNVTINKKSGFSKFRELFILESGKDVKQHLIYNVVVPELKHLVLTLITEGAERSMYGGGTTSPRGTYLKRSSGTHYNYSKVSKKEEPRERSQRLTKEQRDTHDFSSVTFEDRGDAELVLDNLSDLVDKYDSASVADLLSLMHITPNFQDDVWGWTDLRGASIRLSRGRYLLSLPEPEFLNEEEPGERK